MIYAAIGLVFGFFMGFFLGMFYEQEVREIDRAKHYETRATINVEGNESPLAINHYNIDGLIIDTNLN